MSHPNYLESFRNVAQGFQLWVEGWVISVLGTDEQANADHGPCQGMEICIWENGRTMEDSLQIDDDGTPSFHIESTSTLVRILDVLSRGLDRRHTVAFIQSAVGSDMIRRGSVLVKAGKEHAC